MNNHPSICLGERGKTAQKLLLVIVITAMGWLTSTVHAQIFVTNLNLNTIGEYNLDGTVVNAALIPGVNYVRGLAVSGSDLFLTSVANNTLSAYTTSGVPVSAPLVTGLYYNPTGLAVSGPNLYVLNNASHSISLYTTAGVLMNPALVSGLSNSYGIAVSGSRLFVTDFAGGTGLGTVGVYDASTGAAINPTFISGLYSPYAIAVAGSDLFVTNLGVGTIGQYNATTGATVNATLVTGLTGPYAIAVVAAIPEPSIWPLLAGAVALFAGLSRRRSQSA